MTTCYLSVMTLRATVRRSIARALLLWLIVAVITVTASLLSDTLAPMHARHDEPQETWGFTIVEQ